MKFKKGDIIILARKTTNMAAKIGATAIVNRYGYGNEYINISWIKNSLSANQIDGNYFVTDFNLYKEKTIEIYGIVKFMEKLNEH
jgi:hypothetical protein